MTFQRAVQISLTLFFYLYYQYSLAERPSHANYTTSTVHNCVAYECAASLYHPNTLDLNLHHIQDSDFKHYEKIITDYINDSHIQQTNFPGFSSTINTEIPSAVINKALHCHKTKAQQPVWASPQHKKTTVIFHHQCWQLKTSQQHQTNTSSKQAIAISDIVYTVTITRSATQCSSANHIPSPDTFECVPAKTVSPKIYSLLPLDEVEKKRPGYNIVPLDYLVFEVTEEFYAASLNATTETESSPDPQVPDPSEPPKQPELPTPEQPQVPEQPEQPQVPEQPEQPQVPEQPEQPQVPEQPEPATEIEHTDETEQQSSSHSEQQSDDQHESHDTHYDDLEHQNEHDEHESDHHHEN